MQQNSVVNKLANGCQLLSSGELIEVLSSHDTLHKKLTSQYIIERAKEYPKLGLLTGNQLLKDCKDANPVVRSASLQALASLEGMEDVAIGILHKALKDSAPQVRRAAVFSSIHLYERNGTLVLESGLIDWLYEGIGDTDPIVVTNCLLALEKILAMEGGIVVTKKMANHLLKQLNQFSNCSLLYVLNILEKYVPKSEEETFQILNMLDWTLNTVSPSVIVAAVNYFLVLTKDYEHLKKDLVQSVRPGICRVLSQGVPEISASLISFLISTKLDLRMSFQSNYSHFLLHSVDPRYLKKVKLQILPLIITSENSKEIITEIKRYIDNFNDISAVFECLSRIGNYNKETRLLVLSVIRPSLELLHNIEMVSGALECLVRILLEDEEFIEGRQIKVNTFLSHSLLHNIQFVLSNLDMHHSHTMLVLYSLVLFTPFLPESYKIMEQFNNTFSEMNTDCQSMAISVCATVYHSWPASMQFLLSTFLSKGLKSSDFSVQSRSTFVCSALQEDSLEGLDLVSGLSSRSALFKSLLL